MPTIHRAVEVPYTTEQMYHLVNDIKNYSKFIPWCSGSEIVSESETEIRATLSFSGGGVSKSFTTLNRLQPHKMIEIRLVHGPFRQLEGFWRFEPLDDGSGSRVILDIEFEFSSKLLAIMFGPVFNQVAASLVDSFCKHAKEVYGESDL